MSQKRFQTRGFTSLLTTASFVVMTLTGVVAFFEPQGRIAFWVDWHFLGLSKPQWDGMHVLSSFLFVAAGAFHLWFNWKIFLGYLYSAGARALTLKRELALATLLTAVATVAGVRALPPFSLFLDLEAHLKDSWVTAPDLEPPYGHAEQSSLRVFLKKVSVPLKEATEELAAAGVTVGDPDLTLEEIARDNKTTPMALYLLVKKHQVREVPPTLFTPDLVEETFAGTGVGRKTLEQVCREAGVDFALARGRLAAAGLAMKDDETFKEAAARLPVSSPTELLKSALVEGYRPR